MFQHQQFQYQTLLCRMLRQCLEFVRYMLHGYVSPCPSRSCRGWEFVHPKIMANAIPAWKPVSCWPLSESAVHKLTIPKNGANLGVNSASAMMGKL